MGGAQSTTNNSLKTISWRNYGEISDEAKLRQNLNTYLEQELGPNYNFPIKPKVDPKDPDKDKILDDQKTRNGGLTDEEIMKIIGKYPSFNGNYRIPKEKTALSDRPTYVDPERYFIIDPNAQQNTAKCDITNNEVWDEASGQCVQAPAPQPKPDADLDRLQELQDELDNIFKTFQEEANVKSILNDSFEKNLKFYIKDDVFMKYSGETLKKLKTEVAIGTEVIDDAQLDSDPAKAAAVKKEVAEELTNYYITKLIIMANVLSLIEYINKRIKSIRNGEICMAPNNQLLQNTSIEYNVPFNANILGAKANLVGTDPKPVFDFSKDIEGIRKQILGNSENFIFKKDQENHMAFSSSVSCTVDQTVLDQLKDMFENTKNFTAIELRTQAECENGDPAHAGFKWLANDSDVYSNKMFIDETANNEWIALYEELKKTSIDHINKLRTFLLTLLNTKIDSSDPANPNKIVYTDKPLSKTLLSQSVSDCKNIIITTLISFDNAFLTLYKTPMKSLNSTNPNEAQIKQLEAQLAQLKGVASLSCSK